jgi:hypothetical protein
MVVCFTFVAQVVAGCYETEEITVPGGNDDAIVVPEKGDTDLRSAGDADADADTDADTDADSDIVADNGIRRIPEPLTHRPLSETCEYHGAGECLSDHDCRAPFVCECNLHQNRCYNYGNCRVDTDCGYNGYCSPTRGSCGDFAGIVGYVCHTRYDTCINDADCANYYSGGHNPYCAYNAPAGRWMCSDTHCVG